MLKISMFEWHEMGQKIYSEVFFRISVTGELFLVETCQIKKKTFSVQQQKSNFFHK
jgi:hypothetical protein